LFKGGRGAVEVGGKGIGMGNSRRGKKIDEVRNEGGIQNVVTGKN
jgi:hypothetical protein